MVIASEDRQAARWRTLAAAGEREAAEAEAEGESGEPNNSLDKNRPDEFMKLSNRSTRFSRLFTIVLLAGAWGLMTEVLPAAESKEAPQKPAITQRLFASPDEAIKALQSAAEAKDQAALREIFGPDLHELVTGDEVQDANNAQRFATAMAQGCNPVKEGEDKITLEVGTNDWPMPIPLEFRNPVANCSSRDPSGETRNRLPSCGVAPSQLPLT